MKRMGLLISSIFWIHSAQATTISAQRIASSLRLVPLRKLTVGPDDQYNAIRAKGHLIFTRKISRVPHLCSQNLETGEVIDLLPLNADSEEPTFNSESELAFTYYKFRAGGDICHTTVKSTPVKDTEIRCLKTEDGDPSSPFWKSTDELGYVLRIPGTLKSKIIVENIKTGQRQVLAEGNISSPSMALGGRYLFYNLHQKLVLQDLKENKVKTLSFSLPGISGFPAVSYDENYLYFSHYLNDTNNDNIIDGNDNSVIFRAPMSSLLSAGEIFPEQLTSVESNCSFPRPHKGSIYASCAFEGALDIYELPESGIVPSHWTEATLDNAHDTARTYSERILLLNTKKYRFPLKDLLLETRILSNHLLSDDLASSKYYLQKVQSAAEPSQAPFFNLLNLYLDAKEKKKIQRSNEVSPAFEREIQDIRIRMDQVKGYPKFKAILQGLLHTFLNHSTQGANLLKQVSFPSLTHPLEKYFYFELANALPTHPRDETDALMMNASEISQEAQLYYAFRFLTRLGSEKMSVQSRLLRIKKMDPHLSRPIAALLNAEALSLQIILSANQSDKASTYRKLDQLMSETRDNYFLRKAMYIRCILNFTDAGEFVFMDSIATNWLRYTTTDHTEFAYAREVYALANLDEAYEHLGKNQTDLASNYFFGSLLLTDDLESHFGYIKAKVALKERGLIDERYRNLKNHQQIEDNLNFVEALLILIDAQPSSPNDVTHLDRAIEKLKRMKEERDSAVRYLLMGACSLEKLLRLSSGYEFDQKLFENTHRDLMLAYDQGWDNARIKASALINLGILHQKVQNHGLAARLLAKRKEFGFISKEEEAQFAWIYSKSLYYNHQPEIAAQEMKRILSQNPPASLVLPLQERLGFYLQCSEKFSEAATLYGQILNSSTSQASLTDLNQAKLNLSYGYTLFKLNQKELAKKALNQSLLATQKLPVIPKKDNRWIDFEPKRLALIAHGLLSQIGTPSERLVHLEKRDLLLKESQTILDQWPSTYLKNLHQLAYTLNQTSPEKAATYLKNSLKIATELGEASQYLSFATYRTEVAFLTHAISYPHFYLNPSSEIQRLVEKTIHAYTAQGENSPVLQYQKLKLELLWAAYSTRHSMEAQ